MKRTFIIPGVSIAAAALIVSGLVVRRATSDKKADEKTPNPALLVVIDPEFALAEVQGAIDCNNARSLAALLAADADAYAQTFADDGISLPGYDPVARGRDSIRHAVAETFKHARFIGGDIRSTETHVEGETAYEVGEYTFEVISHGVPQTTTGRYLTVWKRVGDDWKIAIDAGQPGAVF